MNVVPDAPQPTSDPSIDVAALRRAYAAGGLSEDELDPDPMVQFERWLTAAVRGGVWEPNAMVLATAGSEGQPSARSVLLKGYDHRGLEFYTNYGSRKARELAENPKASVLFPWYQLERQLIVLGTVERVDRADSAAYFARRPRGSRIGAWVSEQSTVIPDRAWLEGRQRHFTERFAEDDVPLPEGWGGYRLRPTSVEFWQGRADRLHDRLRYRRHDAGWVVERLSP